jgi:hypothetical protein
MADLKWIPAPDLPSGKRMVAVNKPADFHAQNFPEATPEYLAQLNARWDAIRADGIVLRALADAGEIPPGARPKLYNRNAVRS